VGNLKHVKAYLDNSTTMLLFLQSYLEIRNELKRMGYTEEESKRVDKVTGTLVAAYSNFQQYLTELIDETNDFFGLEVGEKYTQSKFYEYFLKDRMKEIDKLTPLGDGNN
jgi:hypothetical protein